ncbi:hypothetical protein DPMN_095366 [Dreissena polymorpha]|uniref:C2H2-type domain-containing protein n=1 Tax=Dreissena polymorpha TaxID=45954 RepID=A0A9D4L6C5_DREPO|nr:hypothetical protein DPMN_095366 [Dreissena polymorpha]
MDAEEQDVIDTAIAEEPLNGSFVEVEIPGDEPFICEICDRSYSRKGTLNRHLKVHDSSQQPCTKCYKFFPSVLALTKHQQ